MASESYWGDLGGAEEIDTPVRVFREQASHLNSIAKSLRANVKTTHTGSLPGGIELFRTTLAIVVPNLDRYRLDIVSAVYPLAIFPLQLSDDLSSEDSPEITCKDESELRAELRAICSAPRTVDTLKRLIALATRT